VVVRVRLVERFPVFHQRVVPARTPVGLPHWEDDPDFTLERHVRRVTLPEPGDDAALQHHIERHLHRPLDRAHPLWEVQLVEGHLRGSAVFCRFHHALADGIALARVMLSLTDEVPEAALEDGQGAGGAVEHRPSGLVLGLGASAVRHALAALGRLSRPGGVLTGVTVAVRSGRVVAELLLTGNPPNVFDGTPAVPKRAVWSQPWPLADLKHVGRLAGATLNDVLLSAVAGALYRYQLDHGGAPTDLVTMVPVNVRPPDQPLPRELGNKFALVFLTLPSGLRRPSSALRRPSGAWTGSRARRRR
jgi:WS/DGAT/MGAT family acyltransferase